MTAPYVFYMRKEKPMREVTHTPTATLVHPGDVLCTEYGDYLVVSMNFTSPQQLGLVHLTDHQLIHQTVTGDEIVVDDFAPFLHEHDVYQVRRHDEPTPTKRYNVSDSGPFRECNITLGTLQAINANDFVKAVDHAAYANPDMTRYHVEDFVLYLMED